MRGGDKAPVLPKAEAKARRYAPFSQKCGLIRCASRAMLDGLRPKSGSAQAASWMKRQKIWRGGLNLIAP
jgi:hypothetical protein